MLGGFSLSDYLWAKENGYVRDGKAKSVIIHKWRAAVIAFAAFLIAVGVLWDKGAQIVHGIAVGIR